MDCIAIGSTIQVETSASSISFTTSGSDHWEIWDRYLCIDGKRAFHLGNICETCTFFFERLSGANQKISAREVSDALHEGIQSVDSNVVLKLRRLLPVGRFTPVLWQWQPSLVTPGSPADYFVKEQVDLWGIDGFWGLPHNPRCEYYRTQKQALDKETGLFHFGVPMYPHNWLEAKTVSSYREKVRNNCGPTAVSISILDVKSPADREPLTGLKTHYCFTHYLIDGHHKTYAAAITPSVCTLLSFVAHERGVSTADDFRKVVELTQSVGKK